MPDLKLLLVSGLDRLFLFGESLIELFLHFGHFLSHFITDLVADASFSLRKPLFDVDHLSLEAVNLIQQVIDLLLFREDGFLEGTRSTGRNRRKLFEHLKLLQLLIIVIHHTI